jgi:hypothetical protein
VHKLEWGPAGRVRLACRHPHDAHAFSLPAQWPPRAATRRLQQNWCEKGETEGGGGQLLPCAAHLTMPCAPTVRTPACEQPRQAQSHTCSGHSSEGAW